jgi:hypothetical protein
MRQLLRRGRIRRNLIRNGSSARLLQLDWYSGSSRTNGATALCDT